ncbi:MAG: hypothetical protein A3K19_03795 [Lentisphaerae bacterium RIFOXYB12_FULL_65_16]|nr:MAG: hypothetical protein A3K18_03070 [Lentisphaerae bacterium RIFOXYA12_64_32]OGV89267.1 MAG: hypothetical protein A3K19_03795 [Lentisphaerae bacterium RIFOXYB12_FULL_65_16]
MNDRAKITVRALLLGALFTVFFAVVTVYFENRKNNIFTATQVAPLPYVLLFVMVLMLNPLCRLVRAVKPFTITEILVIFMMGSVSAGISTFGLASQVVPVISSLFNQHWNNDQSEWDVYVEPFVNEAFFISEPGTTAAAGEYRTSLMALRDLQKVYDTAANHVRCRKALVESESSLHTLEVDTGADPLALNRARQTLSTARQAAEQAGKFWEALRAAHHMQEAPDVMNSYPARIAAQAEDMNQKKSRLVVLENAAFERVDVFRRGLPESLRAFPGFIPIAGESFSIYTGRVRRLRDGTAAYRRLHAAAVTIDAESAPAADAWRAAVDRIQRALDLLQPLGRQDALLAQKADNDREWERLNRQLLGKRGDLKQAREERRAAPASEFGRLDRLVSRFVAEEKDLQRDLVKLGLVREQIQIQLTATGMVAATATDIEKIRQQLAGMSPSDPARSGAARELRVCLARFAGFDASFRRFVIGDVPWRVWARPVLLWFVLVGLTYLVLMSFNVLIFRQWAHNERLVYPLAELPEILAGHTDEDKSGLAWVPSVFRSGLFWVGFAISASVMGWNLLCYAQRVPGGQVLNLTNSWSSYIINSPLQGLLPGARSPIFFTLIGLTFLVPAKISFSLWFFYVLYMCQLLVMVWSGYGVNENSFPTEWWYTFNFRMAEAGGAMMVFAIVVLYKCRKYLLCCVTPASVGDLEPPEQKELRISSFLFLAGSAVLILLLWLGMGANVYYTLFAYFVIMVLTIGLVRAVAEGGILGFQAWVSPFHFVRSLFGMNKTWTCPSLFAPLMVFYSVMFLDLKTFIAPGMANCIKIRDDLKMERLRFHLAIWLAILLAMVSAVVYHIMLAYSRGADSMHNWFYSSFPRLLFDSVCSTTKSMPVDTAHCGWWVLAGGAVMAALLYLRAMWFWLPHPIGLIMLVNPIMATYWFSILLGWLAKSLVTKYGNKDTYRHVRKLFIGLIVGEFFIVVMALVVAYMLDVRVPIDLNR